MPPPPKYTPAEKAAFLAVARSMQRDGATKRQIADHLGLNPASLTAWLREETLNQLYPPLPPTMPHNRSFNTHRPPQSRPGKQSTRAFR